MSKASYTTKYDLELGSHEYRPFYSVAGYRFLPLNKLQLLSRALNRMACVGSAICQSLFASIL